MRRPRHRPGLILGKYGWTHPRRKLRKPYPLRFRKEMSSVERSTLILRPDPLDPGLLMNNPGWRAAIRKIIGREDLP